MQRVGAAVGDGVHGRHQGLTDDLTAEDALPALLRALAAEQILFKPFEVEYGQELMQGSALWAGRSGRCRIAHPILLACASVPRTGMKMRTGSTCQEAPVVVP